MRIKALVLVTLAYLSDPAHAQRPLTLESKIELGDIRGRLDHMAVDLRRSRLFVAQLENDSVGVIDFRTREIVHVITEAKRPQGLSYSGDTLFVANGGDGSLRMFEGSQYRGIGRIELGETADNVRFDAETGHILVSAKAALAVIDVASRRKAGDIALMAQPESFQIDHRSGRIYVNSPKESAVVVLDPATGKRLAVWPMGNASNYPLALNDAMNHVLVVFRDPPKLAALATSDGSLVASTDSCGDADDMFVDGKRSRVYVSCGDGHVDVFDAKNYRRLLQVDTAPGARTSLFVPEVDRLFVAVRATTETPAAIWVFRPEP